MLTKVWYSPHSCLETRRSMLSVNPSKKNMNTVYFDENKILNSNT